MEKLTKVVYYSYLFETIKNSPNSQIKIWQRKTLTKVKCKNNPNSHIKIW